MTELRLVTDDFNDPLSRDDAIAAIEDHWKTARAAYVAAIGQLGEHYLRQLVTPPPDRGITRWHMAAIRDQARDLAKHAARMADELDRAVGIFDRPRTKQPEGSE